MTRIRPDVVAFDVNETLLDLAPVRAALIEAGEPETLLPTVFARTLPDVEPALRRLVEGGFRVVTLSHGSPGVAQAGLERGGITPLIERSLSSEAIRAWKPSREAYLWAAGGCGVPPDRMALVAAHGWDVLGAQRAGLTGAWFPRSERTYPAVYEAPHVTAGDLAGVVDALLALPSP